MAHALRVKFLSVLAGLVSLYIKPLRLLHKILNQDRLLSDSQATIQAVLIVRKRLHVLNTEQVHLQLLSYVRRPVLHQVFHGSEGLQNASPLESWHF